MTTVTNAVRSTNSTARAATVAGAIAIVSVSLFVILLPAHAIGAQQPLTRSEAIHAALGASARVSAIAADTLAAAARLRTAREYPNPSLSASYSRSVPQNHFSVELPLDLPAIRGARVRSAQASRMSARFGFLAARAAIELGVDTMYTTSQGAQLRAALSRATAADATKLLSDTKARRDAGDASDLDVNLAEVAASQAANVANADSLAAIDARLELQRAMGLRGDTVIVELRDSLGAPGGYAPPNVGAVGAVGGVASAPSVAAAGAALTAAQQTLVFQQRNVLGLPAVQFGVEGKDPTGSEKGVLPTFGVVLPIPLFSRNRGEISAAHAEVTRAQAELAIARMDASAQLAAAFRTRTAAEARLSRDRTILDAATHNVSMTERAYAEGEMAIGNVLEARRTQRDAQSQYVTDLVSANVGAALIRVLTTNGTSQ